MIIPGWEANAEMGSTVRADYFDSTRVGRASTSTLISSIKMLSIPITRSMMKRTKALIFKAFFVLFSEARPDAPAAQKKMCLEGRE